MSDAESDDEPSDLLVLDACCVINLAASGHMGEILAACGYRCVVTSYVAREEALGLSEAGDDAGERHKIDLGPLVDAGHVEVREMTSVKELREFVRYAAQVDDGEAWTCALAKLEHGAVATDDRKTLRLLAGEGISTVQTPEMLRRWASDRHIPEEAVGEAVARIERLATFRPNSQAPEYEWWKRYFSP